MKNNRGMWQVLSGIALILLVTSVAQADSFSQIGSLTGTITSANWSTVTTPSLSIITGSDSVTFANNSTTSTTGGNTIQISNSNGNNLIFYNQGSSWLGNFSPGELLIATDNPAGADTLTLSFTGTDISEFGVDIQDYGYSSFEAFITVNGSAPSATFSEVSAAGNVGFLGVEGANGSDISSVTISIPSSGCSPCGISPNYFALGTAQIVQGPLGGGGSTPEPASLMLVATGIGAIAWKLRKRARA